MFSEQDHHIRDRILRVYLALFQNLIIINLAYIGGAASAFEVYNAESDVPCYIVTGFALSFLSMLFALFAAVPGIYCLDKQREHNWAQFEQSPDIDRFWKEAAVLEDWAARFLVISIVCLSAAFLCLFLAFF